MGRHTSRFAQNGRSLHLFAQPRFTLPGVPDSGRMTRSPTGGIACAGESERGTPERRADGCAVEHSGTSLAARGSSFLPSDTCSLWSTRPKCGLRARGSLHKGLLQFIHGDHLFPGISAAGLTNRHRAPAESGKSRIPGDLGPTTGNEAAGVWRTGRRGRRLAPGLQLSTLAPLTVLLSLALLLSPAAGSGYG